MVDVSYYYGLIDDITYNNVNQACAGMEINRIPLVGNASVIACNRALGVFNTATEVIDPYFVYGECPIVVPNKKYPEFYESSKFLQDTGL
jgi:hypothetical protein